MLLQPWLLGRKLGSCWGWMRMTHAKPMKARVPRSVENQQINTNNTVERWGKREDHEARAAALWRGPLKKLLVMYTSHHDHQVTHQNSEPNYASSVRKAAYFLSSWPFSRSLLEALRETAIFLEAFVHLCASVKHCDITTTKRKRHCPALLDSLEMPDFDTSKQPQLFKEPLQVRLKLPHILEP